MNREEIKEYLKRTDELELKLTGEDKDTYQWVLFGYNQCAKLLNETERENQKLVNQQKEFIEYLEEQIKDMEEEIGNSITKPYKEGHIIRRNVYQEILSKYKGIIGDK